MLISPDMKEWMWFADSKGRPAARILADEFNHAIQMGLPRHMEDCPRCRRKDRY